MTTRMPEVQVPLMVQIVIAGPSQAGKTYVSAHVEELLRKLGYEVRVSESNSSCADQRHWEKVRKFFRAKPSRAHDRGLSVEITVLNWLL